jgi:hypothetical protein
VESKQLFKENFDIDINITNPCLASIETEVEVEHVKDDIYKTKKGKLYRLVGNELVKLI